MVTQPEKINPNRFHKSRILKTRQTEQNVYDLALDRTENAFKLFDHIAVSFSGGKDSTACLQVAYEVARSLNRLPLHVFFWDEEAIPYQTEEYCRRVSQWPGIDFTWWCIPYKMKNACSSKEPWWWPWAHEVEHLWVRPLPPEAITEKEQYIDRDWPHYEFIGHYFDPKRFGTVGQIMGIRAQESLARLRSVCRRDTENYLIKYNERTSHGNMYKVYPIYDWSTEDIWTAPKKFGWDYNRTYDVFDKAGIPPHHQRCSPAFGQEPLQKLWVFRVAFPELWEKMIYRVPGANTAIRYALTQLYAAGGDISKPDDLSWEEYIRQLLDDKPEKDRVRLAKRIRKEINRHFKKTDDPIMAYSPHPDSGLNWKILAEIALRDDPVERRQPSMKQHPWGTAGYHKQAEKYRQELAALQRGEDYVPKAKGSRKAAYSRY